MQPGDFLANVASEANARLHVDGTRVCMMEVRQPEMLADVLIVDDRAAETGRD